MTKHKAFQKLELPCVHCKEHEAAHVAGKCLFEATAFRSMTEEEFSRWTLRSVDATYVNPTHLYTSKPRTEQDIIQAHAPLTRKAWLSRK